jgi:hypothetical protein
VARKMSDTLRGVMGTDDAMWWWGMSSMVQFSPILSLWITDVWEFCRGADASSSRSSSNNSSNNNNNTTSTVPVAVKVLLTRYHPQQSPPPFNFPSSESFARPEAWFVGPSLLLSNSFQKQGRLPKPRNQRDLSRVLELPEMQ